MSTIILLNVLVMPVRFHGDDTNKNPSVVFYKPDFLCLFLFNQKRDLSQKIVSNKLLRNKNRGVGELKVPVNL